MKRKLITIFSIIGLWWIAASMVSREVILPLPFTVFSRMIDLILTPDFYISVALTLFRIFVSLAIALVIGVTLGILSGLNKKIDDFINPVFMILQTIPQISFILILIVWFRSSTALIVIIILIILPVFYNNAKNGVINIDAELKDVILLYDQPFYYNFFKVYIPLIKSYIVSALDSGFPMSIKTGVMAEIFVQTGKGIGTQLYYARTQIDMVSIFAWTIWMIIIISMLTYLFNKISKKRNV